MTNKHSFHRPGRDRAVRALTELRDATGHLTAGDFAEAADSCGYSTRQLRRVLAEHDASATGLPAQPRPEFVIDADVIEMVFLTCGNLANARDRLQREKGLAVPSLSTFKRKVKTELGSKQLAWAKDGSKAARNTKVYLKRHPETRGYSYLLDHTQLPIYVVPSGHRTAVRPWMTAVLDAETDYILSWLITFGTPTAEEVRAALMGAFTQRLAEDGQTVVGGLPTRCVWDRGLDFLSELVTESCQRLGPTPVALPAYSPHLKGRLERMWRFVKENGLAPLPGYTDRGSDLAGNLLHARSALSEPAFLIELDKWITWRHTQHTNRTLGVTPLQAWKNDPTPLCPVPADQLWQDFLLLKDKVKVGKAGVRFKGIDYVDLDCLLDKVIGESVEVRHLPHDRTFIEVFHKGTHLATCYPSSELTSDDMLAFFEARRASDALARTRFKASNRLRTEHPEATRITQDAKRGQKTRMLVTTPEIDLFAGADQALRKLDDGQPDGQLRIL